MSPLSTIPKILFALAAFLDPSYTRGEMKMFESRYTLVTLSPLLLQQPLDVHFAVKLLREGARQVFHVTLPGAPHPPNRQGSVLQTQHDLSALLYPGQLS